jgi:hypothetical protein
MKRKSIIQGFPIYLALIFVVLTSGWVFFSRIGPTMKLIFVGLLISLMSLSLGGCYPIPANKYAIAEPVLRGKPYVYKIPLNVGLYISPDFEYFSVKKWKGPLWHYDNLGKASAKQFELELNNIFRKVEVIYEKPPFKKNIWKEKARKLNAIIEPKIEKFYFGIPIWNTLNYPARIRYEIVFYDMNRNIIFKKIVEGIGNTKGRWVPESQNASIAASRAIEEGVSKAIETILTSDELKTFLKVLPK